MYMKQYERSKIILLKEVNNALEMASYIESLQCAAIIYCEKECPEEIIYNSDTDKSVTHQGLARFFNRDIM